MSEDADKGWGQWSNHVLEELKRLSRLSEKHDKSLVETRLEFIKELQSINTQIAMLQVKSGAWGLIAGAIPLVVLALGYLVKKAVGYL